MTKAPSLYLASKSPRRRQLLEQLGIIYQCVDVDIDESLQAGESPGQYVARMAVEKGKTAQQVLSAGAAQTSIILAADTCIAYQDKILGKPVDDQDAVTMLTILSGVSHVVLSAFAVFYQSHVYQEVVASRVEFDELSQHDIVEYVKTGEPGDKAGAYAVQGQAAAFIKHIEGSFSNVMGLPLYELSRCLKHLGLWEQVRRADHL